MKFHLKSDLVENSTFKINGIIDRFEGECSKTKFFEKNTFKVL